MALAGDSALAGIGKLRPAPRAGSTEAAQRGRHRGQKHTFAQASGDCEHAVLPHLRARREVSSGAGAPCAGHQSARQRARQQETRPHTQHRHQHRTGTTAAESGSGTRGTEGGETGEMGEHAHFTGHRDGAAGHHSGHAIRAGDTQTASPHAGEGNTDEGGVLHKRHPRVPHAAHSHTGTEPGDSSQENHRYRHTAPGKVHPPPRGASAGTGNGNCWTSQG